MGGQQLSIGVAIQALIVILLVASFIPDIITNFNEAENTTGADASLSTGFDIAQIILGVATGFIALRMIGINVTGGGGGGGGGRRRR